MYADRSNACCGVSDPGLVGGIFLITNAAMLTSPYIPAPSLNDSGPQIGGEGGAPPFPSAPCHAAPRAPQIASPFCGLPFRPRRVFMPPPGEASPPSLLSAKSLM